VKEFSSLSSFPQEFQLPTPNPTPAQGARNREGKVSRAAGSESKAPIRSRNSECCYQRETVMIDATVS